MPILTEKWPTAESRQGLIEQYLKRTQTQGDFCEVHGLSRSTLQNWLRRYQAGSADGRRGFIEVVAAPKGGVVRGLEIEYPNGVKVRATAEISMEALRRLIHLYA
jgi:transposase-like protein